ncbi:MAG: apolipoprotein N-acyltransferase [Phycisphaeraceae bacterium]|nr:apolipoprotein N-acyltransferase [Phycisphaeraceae bacterium]
MTAPSAVAPSPGRWRTLFMVAGCTLAYGLLLLASFPPWSLWILAPVVITPLVIAAVHLARASGAVRLAGVAIVWLFALPAWLWTERWIIDVSDAGWPALSALMAIWPALFVGGLARVVRTSPGLSWRAIPLAAALLWTGIECFRAHLFFDGYPWYLLAHPLIDATWVAQIAALGGVTVLSAVCAWTGSEVARVIIHRESRPRPWKALAPVVSAWIVVIVIGPIELGRLDLRPGPSLAVIQTNVPSSNKVAWKFEQQIRDFERFRDLSVEAIVEARRRGSDLQLIAWPETMLPGFGLERDTIRLQIALQTPPADLFSSAIEELVEKGGVPMLLGSNAFEGLTEDGRRWHWHRRYNSAYLVRGEPPYERYDKMQLTPFGETMPYIRASKWLEQKLLDLGARGFTFDLDEGTELVVFTLGDGTRIVTPICFEITIPGLCRRLVVEAGERRADLIINLSNDGWFGSVDDGRRAHELAARWRAVELRTPVVRVANTGLSSLIDPAGRVITRLPPREDGWLLVEPPLAKGLSLYARIGDVGSWIMMLGAALLAARTFMPNHRRARSSARAMALFALLALPLACDAPPAKRSPQPTPPVASPGVARADLGLNAPVDQQAWSTREQSVAPEVARASSESPARPTSPGIPVMSSGSAYRSAVDLLQTAARSNSPILVANAIEELTIDPEALRPVVGKALVHPNRGVRFVAAMAVGKARLDEMANLVQPLLMDQSESVRAAAIFALARLGLPVDMTPLAEMVRSDNPEVRGNAVMILGDLGNPSAIPLLRSTIGLGMTRADPARRRITDLQTAEALAKLGEDSELEPIRAALFAPSHQAEFIALACQMVARIRDGGSIGTLQAVAYAGGDATRPPEIRLLALIALADLGAGDPTICTDFARTWLMDRNPQLRSLAVRAMAACGHGSALPQVEARLYDSNPEVQIAAAGALLRLAAGGHIPRSR